MKKVLPLLVLMLATQNLLAQEGFSTVEERMTGKEFAETGLSKLTPEELAALNAWLRSHSVATLDNASQPIRDTRGFEIQAMQDMDDSTVVSRILGPFDGWRGKGTVFRLENGMVWEQVESGTFAMPATENPVVVIESGLFNSWRLKVEGYNKTVRVERIQ